MKSHWSRQSDVVNNLGKWKRKEVLKPISRSQYNEKILA